MTKQINEARSALEAELQRATEKPCQLVTERLIDLIVAVRDELRKRDGEPL